MSLWIFRIALKALCRLSVAALTYLSERFGIKQKAKLMLRLEFEAYEKMAISEMQKDRRPCF